MHINSWEIRTDRNSIGD